MLLSISFVPVKQITSNIPRSNFSDEEINRVAELIVKGEGIINPLILRSTSLESYEVVDGHFEYYAAARAREIDLRKGEMIGAFIIEAENQEVLEAQIQILRNSKLTNHNSISFPTNISGESNNLESRLTNMESRSTNTDSRLTNFESRVENRLVELQAEYRREIKAIGETIKLIEDKLPTPIEPLEALN
ncbi:MAG: ParB N-terminal domain-containing protein, partial [Scytonema sp. PMC 1069.18]|nr:ParB N-terminal domain-containing protein [Scytonema sp. PMC 1069.18]